MSIARLLRGTSIIALSVFVLCGSPIVHARADEAALSEELHRNLDVRFERCGGYNVRHRREAPRRRIVFDGASFRF